MFIFNKENIAYGRRISSAFNFLIDIATNSRNRLETYEKRLEDINLQASAVEIQAPKSISSAIPTDYLKRFTENFPIHTTINGLIQRSLLRVSNPNPTLRYAFFSIPSISGIFCYNPLTVDGNIINELMVIQRLGDLPKDYITLGRIDKFNNYDAIGLKDKTYSQTPYGTLAMSLVLEPLSNGIYLFTGQNSLVIDINRVNVFKIISPNSKLYTVQRIKDGDSITGNYTDIFKINEV